MFWDWAVYFKGVSFMLCELYFDKIISKENNQKWVSLWWPLYLAAVLQDRGPFQLDRWASVEEKTNLGHIPFCVGLALLEKSLFLLLQRTFPKILFGPCVTRCWDKSLCWMTSGNKFDSVWLKTIIKLYKQCYGEFCLALGRNVVGWKRWEGNKELQRGDATWAGP